jgi:inner membrane protein
VLKLFIIGFLGLLLLIPSILIQSLIEEREKTRDQAVTEISSKWGSDQSLGGPVLTVPFRRGRTNEQGKTELITDYAHFFPERLDVRGRLTPEKRYRGIYVVMLYNAQLTFSGRFRQPDFAALKIRPEDVQWNDAFVSFGLTDLKGIRRAIQMKFGEQQLQFEPGEATPDLFQRGVGIPVKLVPGGTAAIPFTLNLNLNGSNELNVLPLGQETNVELTSPWPTPSFVGTFLPEQRSVTGEGFTACWKVLHYNRNYPQQGVGAFVNFQPTPVPNEYRDGKPVINDESGRFGVKLLLPVDEYQKTARSAKYSVLFVLLTFTAFFFVEILNKRRLHPIQYLLVGVAVVLFYVLLLSISEYLSFANAYAIAVAVILGMVFLYTKAIFRSLRLAIIFNGILAIFYGFFYSLLQLEDYALLMGSFGLVLILGVVMYLTRNLDWYRAYGEPRDPAGAVPQ